MRLLLIDASRVTNPATGQPFDPDRPSESNGTVINEIGNGTRLSPNYPPPPDNLRPGEEPPPKDLPPYDIQFDPEGLRGVESVVFAVTVRGTTTYFVDNVPPYAVSRAQDGFFRALPILNQPASSIKVTARAYSRDIYDDPAALTEAVLAEPLFVNSLRGETSVTFSVTADASVRTEFDRRAADGTFDTAVEAEAESGTEARTFVSPNRSKAAVALASAGGARGAGALVGALTSASISLKALDTRGQPLPTGAVAPGGSAGTFPAEGGTPTPGLPPASSIVTRADAEAEAEVEVEAEAEARAIPSAAAAVAGTTVTLAGTGVDAYLRDDGLAIAVASESVLAVDAASSTATSLSPRRFEIETLPTEKEAASTTPKQYATANDSAIRQGSAEPDETTMMSTGAEPVEVETARVLVLQADTEAEVEVGTEAEAEARAGEGSAAAAATGGTGVLAAGDFAAGAAYLTVATSAVTNTVRDAYPEVFLPENRRRKTRSSYTESNQTRPPTVSTDPNAGALPAPRPLTDPNPPDGTVAVQQTLVTVPKVVRSAQFQRTGRGLSEAEAEAEAEAEVEAEVGNGSAAVACVGVGGGGASGLAATGRVAAASSASTIAFDRTTGKAIKGTEVRANDQTKASAGRESSRAPRFDPLGFALAEVEATILGSGGLDELPPFKASSGPIEGDIRVASPDVLRGLVSPNVVRGTAVVGSRPLQAKGANGRPPNGSALVVANPDGNLEVEVEAEVEVEVEAEAGFTSAAAGAAAVAVQAENGLVVTPAEAAAATSTSTSVFGSSQNQKQDEHRPGPALPGERGGIPVPNVDLTRTVFEAEMEAEAEAEVGYFAGAAAASAAGVGHPERPGAQRVTNAKAAATPYGAAAGAAAGPITSVTVYVSPESDQAEKEQGEAYVYVSARDPEGGPVSIALAVAGIPTPLSRMGRDGRPVTVGVDNEYEFERSAVGDKAIQGIDAFYCLTYKYVHAVTNQFIDHRDTPDVGTAIEGDGPESTFEDESEAEAEAEAEAGYGVAAAAAGAGAAGIFSDVAVATQTATANRTFAYGAIARGLPLAESQA